MENDFNATGARCSLGSCPRCGSEVFESPKGFFCEKDGCRFGIWRDNRFFAVKNHELTSEEVTALLSDGFVFMQQLYSERTDKYYDAYVHLEDDGEKTRFRLEFPNND